ncbi:MAG: DUF1552 domain-containing protein [Proteobacteria bacterium]|nr:DUF1552 domain-containing protein [Pseudomonadota bacterium]
MSLTRRQFALSAGASLLAAPFLGLLRTNASAAPATAKRLIVFFNPNGTVPAHWRPTGSGSNFSFRAGSILEPVAAHRDNLIVCDGLDFYNATNHEGGMATMLTGGGDATSATGGMSLDQYIASQLGSGTRFPSLEFGVQTSAWGGSVQTRMSYRGPNVYAPPDDSPKSIFERMYGDLLGDPAQVEARLVKRQSILDTVQDELRVIHGWIGKQEREKLDAHITSLRQVEQGLQGGIGDCESPGAITDLNPYDNDSFPAIGRAQIDLMVSALACGMTRVASLQWSHTVGPPVFTWLGINEGHHSLSHMDDGNTVGVGNFVKAERWFAEQFAYLLDSLESLPEPSGDGSMLDNSVVLWAKEMGDSRLHVCRSVPFIIAGRAGGYFKPGKYIDFGGTPHNKLLVSVCHAMGLSNETFGNPAAGTGPAEGLS